MTERFIQKGLGFSVVGDVGVNVVNYKGSIGDAEWDAYIKFGERIITETTLSRAIVVTPQSGPTAKQRQQLSRSKLGPVMSAMTQVALVTGSTLVRGSVTALSWLRPSSTQIKAFRVEQTRDGIRWLGSTAPIDALALTNEVVAMLRDVGIDPQETGL